MLCNLRELSGSCQRWRIRQRIITAMVPVYLVGSAHDAESRGCSSESAVSGTVFSQSITTSGRTSVEHAKENLGGYEYFPT
ncbi:hypothetical protein K458DRAFT_193349 [Lentithecium fluviatile CBS 122367]|uniref:Uncharacterized protein n=1 Tax=Lentithecium fluviatile CBS 122367 TaxID=1168545 RepID=A0A6G1ICY4_9PLEO|nr:hypothetical protein K458DRAFT_193349 [Lentithecium fluviatile CBS 122367]